jgi:hemerythrin superfamily protein
MAPGISDAIKKDHREIESYFDKIVTSTDKDEQTRFQNLFTWELARHSIGEELVIYPLFEKLLPDGIEMANKDRNEHLTVS